MLYIIYSQIYEGRSMFNGTISLAKAQETHVHFIRLIILTINVDNQGRQTGGVGGVSTPPEF